MGKMDRIQHTLVEQKYTKPIDEKNVLNVKINEEIYSKYKNIDTKYIWKSRDNRVVLQESLLLDEIIKTIVFRTGAETISIYLYDQKENLLAPVVIYGKEEYFHKVGTAGLNDSLPGKCYREKCMCRRFLDHIVQDAVREALVGDGVDGVEVYPVGYEGDIFGTLTITLLWDEGDSERFSFMEQAARQIGMIIKNDMVQRELENELSKRLEVQEEMELFFNTTADLVCIVGSDGIIKRAGSQWERLLGWKNSEVVGRYIGYFCAEESLSRIVEEKLKIQITGELNNSLSAFREKGGKYRWFSWNTRYIAERDVYICSGRDVTEQRDLEQLVKLESIKNEQLTNLSHEFRTPINIILSSIQLMEKQIDQEKNSGFKHLPLLKQNAYRLLRLVNNILDMAKVDSGQYCLHIQNQNIISIVEEITLSIAQYIQDKGIKLIFDTEIEECIIACDGDSIERIMLNLLSNAVKYTDVNGLISVYVIRDEEFIRVSVKDSGDGMEINRVNRVFDRFVQLNERHEMNGQGTGIGLNLVKSLVEMHGGQITVESILGEGTEFVFSLPIKQVNEESGVTTLEIKSTHMEKCMVEFADLYN